MNRTTLFLMLLLVILSARLAAQGAEKIIVKGESYSVPKELVDARLSETFSIVDRVDVSPSGKYAIAVRVNKTRDNEAKKELTSYDLLVLNRNTRKVIREISAWRQATFPGKWDKKDIYHFYGGTPYESRGNVEYLYDANINRIVGYE